MIPPAIEAFFANSAMPLTLASGTATDEPLLLANDAFCAMSGYSREQVLGRNCRFLQGTDRQQPAREEIRRAVAERRDVQVTIRNFRADGTPFENLLFLYSLTGGDGRAMYFMGSQFELKPRLRQVDFDRHAHQLDSGVARILAETQHTQIRKRRLLAEAAVGVLKAKIDFRS